MKEKRLTQSLPAKIIAFFLISISASVTVGSYIVISYFVDKGFYLRTLQFIKEDIFGLTASENSTQVYKAVELGYSLRYWLFVFCIFSLLLTVVLFVFLMCAAGHKKGHDEIVPGLMGKIPFDLITAGFVGLFVLVM